MNNSQINHLKQIQRQFKKEHENKYIKGAIEHEGELELVSADQLLEFAIEEVLDLVSYLYTLRQNIDDSLYYCQKANGIRACKNCGLGQ